MSDTKNSLNEECPSAINTPPIEEDLLEVEDLDIPEEELEDMLEAKARRISSFYHAPNQPDYFNFKTFPKDHINDPSLSTTIVENDYYLDSLLPNPLFGASIRAANSRHESFEAISSYSLDSHEFTHITELYQPHHGHTIGGKGLSLYPNPVIYTTAEMSSIVNFDLSQSCPAQCAFCKESNMARSFTQLSGFESMGIIEIKFIDQVNPDSPPQEHIIRTSSKNRIKFYDVENEIMMIGPISIPLSKGFPIAIDSLRKLVDNKIYRVLQD